MITKHFAGIEKFTFLQPLQDSWKVIRDEYFSIKDFAKEWTEAYLHNGGWKTIPLVFNGSNMPQSNLAPTTLNMVRQIPDVFIAGFSVMAPGAVIKPHFGYTKKVLRCHLGLSCNQDAWIDVGGIRKHWVDGDIFVFDDTVLHSAANPGDTDRVILIVDFSHGTV